MTTEEPDAAPSPESSETARRGANAPTICTVALDDLLVDVPGVWRRPVDPEVVDDYAEQLGRGAAFPAVAAIEVDDIGKVLTEGLHRVSAHRKVGKREVAVDLRTGTLLDAKLHAVSANARHGLRLTRAQKREAVLHLLTDPDIRGKKDRAIGKLLGVSHEFVRRLRKEASGDVKASARGRGRRKADERTPANVDNGEPQPVTSETPEPASDPGKLDGGDTDLSLPHATTPAAVTAARAAETEPLALAEAPGRVDGVEADEDSCGDTDATITPADVLDVPALETRSPARLTLTTAHGYRLVEAHLDGGIHAVASVPETMTKSVWVIITATGIETHPFSPPPPVERGHQDQS